ncbi:hypothetical protein [Microbacterium sp.]
MDYGFLSHIVLWVVAAIGVVGTIGVVLSFWFLGRQNYRKN